MSVVAASACAPSLPARRDLVLALLGEPASVFSGEASARVLAAALTESLVRRDARSELVPRLAEDVPTFENGGLRVAVDAEAPSGRLVATFRLRADARWHDGRAITSADVRFAHEEDRAASVGSEARELAERIEAVEPIDDRSVRVFYRAGERWDGYALAPRVLPRHVLAGAGAQARAAYDRDPMHAGPFTVAAWSPGHGATLRAFPGYVGGPPPLGRIEVRFFRDRASILDALRRGEVDVAPAPALEADIGRVLDRIADGTERSRLLAYYTPAESLDVLRFGARFADARVRKAIALAIDRTVVVDSVFAGRARTTRTYLVPPSWAAADLGPIPRADRAAARALLAEAGYRPGSFGIFERGGDRLVITLLAAAGSASRLEAARLVAGALAGVGIAAEVRERPLGEIVAALARGDVDLALVPEPASDPLRATESYRGRVGAWFDVLASGARGAEGRAEKRALYGELQRLWTDAAAALPLYQHLAVDVAPRALAGVQPTSHGAPLTWNMGEWRYAPP